MISKFVFLKSEKDAVDFVNTITKFPSDIDMLMGRYVIDAKSILGVLGLGVGKKVEIQILEDEAEQLLQYIQPYIVE